MAYIYPLIKLNLKQLCEHGFDFNRLSAADSRNLTEAEIESACTAFIGQSFAYREEELVPELAARKQTIDQFLSAQLVRGFAMKPIKSPSLIWFGRRFDCVILTVCDPRGRLNPDWLRAIPAFFESGRDYVGRTDRPYAYWDGRNLHRLYPRVSVESPTAILVSDFGNGFGWSVGVCEPEDVAHLAVWDEDNWEYSCAPREHEQIVTVDGARYVLLHSQYQTE